MRYSIDRLPPSNEPFTVWANNVTEDIRTNNLMVGSDIKYEQSPIGTKLSINNQHKYPEVTWRYKGEYDITASYQIGDVIRVMPNKTYTYPASWSPTIMPAGTSIKIPDSRAEGDMIEIVADYPIVLLDIAGSVWLLNSTPPTPGTWVCTTSVPNVSLVQKIISMYQYPGFNLIACFLDDNSSLDSTYYQLYQSLRFTNPYYMPIWPETMVKTGTKAVFSSNWTGNCPMLGYYWEMIGMLPIEKCGYYIGMFPSGSL